MAETHEEHKHQDDGTGYWQVTCSCGWTSPWEYFLGHAKQAFWRHLDEVLG